MKKYEPNVGEKIKFEIQCMERNKSDDCRSCYYFDCNCSGINCEAHERIDKKSVYFKTISNETH